MGHSRKEIFRILASDFSRQVIGNRLQLWTLGKRREPSTLALLGGCSITAETAVSSARYSSCLRVTCLKTDEGWICIELGAVCPKANLLWLADFSDNEWV